MPDNTVDEKLIEWNDIFDQLLVDATTLIKDFSGFVNWPVFFVFLLFCLGATALLVPIVLGRDLQLVLAGGVVAVSCVPSGLAILQYWYKMRQRYTRLFALVEKVDTR